MMKQKSQYMVKYRATDKGKSAERKYQQSVKGKATISRLKIDYHQRTRLKAIEILGGKCCNPDCLVPGGCADYRCLQFDHINGGGTKEIHSYGSAHVPRFIVSNPEEAMKRYQLLCANCNWIKRATHGEVSHYGKKGRPAHPVTTSD